MEIGEIFKFFKKIVEINCWNLVKDYLTLKIKKREECCAGDVRSRWCVDEALYGFGQKQKHLKNVK